MYSNFCPEHGNRLEPVTIHGGERPRIVMVCKNCQREGAEASQLEADRARADGDD